MNLRTAVTLWPTPDARCHKSGKGRKENGHSPQLEAVVGGLLNPTWVEWLMNVPDGWISFACSATEWSRWLAQSRSALCSLTPSPVLDRSMTPT